MKHQNHTMFQQQAESEGIQPNHSNMPNSISEEPINRLPSNSGGSANQSQLFYTPNSSPEEPINNRLPSNLGGTAHQPQLFYMPNSNSEEPIHPLPSNLRGSSHQSNQFFEPEIELEEGVEAESEGIQPYVSPSSQSNSSSEESISSPNQSDLLSERGSEPEEEEADVSPSSQSNSSSEESISSPNQSDQSSERESEEEEEKSESEADHNLTAEHLNYYRSLYKAAQSGDLKTAKSFIDSDPDALTANISRTLGTVLHIAAHSCQWKLVLMLLELDVSTPQSIAVNNLEGCNALHYVAEGGSLKTAKALVEKNSDLLQIVDKGGYLPLVLAIYSKNKELVWYLSKKTRVESPSPPFFIPELPMILRNLIQTGYHDIALYFVKRFPLLAFAKDEYKDSLLSLLALEPSYFFSSCNLGFFERGIYKFVRVEIQSAYSQSITQGTILGWSKRLLWKAITQLAPSIKIVRDAKMTHECANELVNQVVNQIKLSTMSYSQICDFLKDPINIAIEGGTEEIVRTLLKEFPDLTFMYLAHQRNILQAAIECRQENIVNLLKETSPLAAGVLCSYPIDNINTLHLAGKLAPDFKLFSVSGTALQMQRELQWFKEVEMHTMPSSRGVKDSENQTAKDAFREAHKELSKDGEKWMKDTANSCMLVSTLIATVLFAAAFTVPGGNVNDKGIPIFLRSKAFTVFAISNALGLFSSLTSLLMFLAIITARYDIEDFLESLPRKLIIGLGSLFFAIVAMIIAFGAALTIILSERWHWVSVAITLLASFPVATFVMLQLPLISQMVWSTYGASIFRPLPSRV